MPDVLFIEPCNFLDFPVGGQLSFARQMIRVFGARLALVGISTDETPVGQWVKRTFDGAVCDFLSVGHWRPSARKPLLPRRARAYGDIVRHRRQIVFARPAAGEVGAWLVLDSVTGPGTVAFTGLAVCVLRYLNSSTTPSPSGAVTRPTARCSGCRQHRCTASARPCAVSISWKSRRRRSSPR